MKKVIVIVILLSAFTLFAKEQVVSTPRPKDWNMSVNLQYYGTISMGSVVFINYRYLHGHINFAHTVVPDEDMNFTTFGGGIGGQYDMMKSEKFDSIIFAGASLNMMLGTMYQMTHDGGSRCDFLLLGPVVGYEFSVGSRNLKFNTGISLDVQFSVYSREEDENGKSIYNDEIGFFFWFTSPALRLYAGIKF